MDRTKRNDTSIKSGDFFLVSLVIIVLKEKTKRSGYTFSLQISFRIFVIFIKMVF